MVCGSWPIAAVKGRAYRQTLCGPRPEPGMRSIQQRGPGPVPGPIPGPAPDPGPSRRQPGSTQRHWRPKPEPGTVQQAQRAGVCSTERESADWWSTTALLGAAAALLLEPAPAVNKSTATMNSNLGFTSFPPQLPPRAIGLGGYNYAKSAHDASSLRMMVPTCSPRNAGSSSCGFSPLMIWIRLTCRALPSRSSSTRSKGRV